MKKSRLMGSMCVILIIYTFPAYSLSFTPIGDLPGGTFFSVPMSMSADGTVIVGQSHTSSGNRAFRWESGSGMVGLGALPGGVVVHSLALDVSADGGVVVGRATNNTRNEAFVWTNSTGMIGIGDLSSGSFSSTATGVSSDGGVIVGYGSNASGTEAFRWTSSGGMVGLGGLDGTVLSGAQDVSADGNVVVGGSNGQAFMWTPSGGMSSLGHLYAGDDTSALGISLDGSVVMGHSLIWDFNGSQRFEAFRWTSDGGMVGLGDLAGGEYKSIPKGMSSDGSMIVGYGFSDKGKEAVIWDEANGLQSVQSLLEAAGVNLTGWSLLEAMDVESSGKVVTGWGINPDGNTEAWVANLSTIPIPAALWLFGSGLLGLIGVARRRVS